LRARLVSGPSTPESVVDTMQAGGGHLV